MRRQRTVGPALACCTGTAAGRRVGLATPQLVLGRILADTPGVWGDVSYGCTKQPPRAAATATEPWSLARLQRSSRITVKLDFSSDDHLQAVRWLPPAELVVRTCAPECEMATGVLTVVRGERLNAGVP